MRGPKPHTKLVHMPNMPRNVMMRVAEDGAEKPEAAESAAIEPPTWLGSRAKKIFERKASQIQAAGYWDERFSDALTVLATLLVEHRRDPAGLSAARLTQLRLLLSELGLTCGVRIAV